MRIYGNQLQLPIDQSSHQIRAVSQGQTQVNRHQGSGTHTDQLNLSPKARAIQMASHLLAQTSDIRDKAIEELTRDLESGRYNVKTDQIAEKMMRDQLLTLFY